MPHALGSSTTPGEATVPNLKAPLRRSRSNRMIAGVVAGLARYFDIDPTLGRVLYVVASVVSAAFPGILVYVILWIIVPEGD
jgi:phage shock protein C